MGRDGGVEVTHKAVKDAKTDLEEVLELMRPSPGNHKVTPVFAQNGAVRRLLGDRAAIGGFWPAAQGFQTSVQNAEIAVGGAYTEITTQLTYVIGLLNTAVTKLENTERDGMERAGQIQV